MEKISIVKKAWEASTLLDLKNKKTKAGTATWLFEGSMSGTYPTYRSGDGVS